MEKQNREGCNAGRSSQGLQCGPERVPGSLEFVLKKSSQGPYCELENPPPGLDPNTPHLPMSLPIVSDLGQPRKSPLTDTEKKYPLMKQRGFYSDILSPGTLDQLGVRGSCSRPSLSPPYGLIFSSSSLSINLFI